MKQTIILLFCITILSVKITSAQTNRYEEVIPYTLIDNKIILSTKINGSIYQLLFSPEAIASTSLLKSTADKAEIIMEEGEYIVKNLSIGEAIFHPKTVVRIIENDYLLDHGIDGIAGAELFPNNVITIDSRDQTITISAPYKPSYVELRNRVNMTTRNCFDITVSGKSVNVNLDLTSKHLLLFANTDYDNLASVLANEKTDVGFQIPVLYQDISVKGRTAFLPVFTLAKKEFQNIEIYNSPEIKISSIGAMLLETGLLSIDYSKSKLYFEPFETLKKAPVVQNSKTDNAGQTGEIVHIDRTAFLKDIFNFREQKEWIYQGDKPAVIDYWAEWCGPCKRLNPILEQLATEYKDRISFYKVNIDEETEIKNYFDINSIPLLMYIPMEGKPIVVLGLRSKEQIKQIIEEKLLVD